MTPISSFELVVLERGIEQVRQEGHQEENRKRVNKLF